MYKRTKFTKSIRELFPDTSEEMLEILEQMLEYNPYFRPSAK
jgi:hypothetical protein